MNIYNYKLIHGVPVMLDMLSFTSKDIKINWDYCQSGVGGGVLLYVYQNLAAVPCKVLNDVGFNSLWFTVSLLNNDKLLVGIFSTGLHNQWLLLIINNLVSFPHLPIMGDFQSIGHS